MESGIYIGSRNMAPDERRTAREHKGHSLLTSTDNYVVIDIETTGLDPASDSIIELGAIRFRGDKAVSEFSTLINPGFEIDEYISELTGITNDMLISAPSLDQQLPAYLDFIGNDIIIGHNVNFDINFLYDSSQLCGLPPVSNDFVDTMRLSRRLFAEYRHHRLQDLASRFGINVDGEHRAIFDCVTVAKAYQYMRAYMQQNDIHLNSLRHNRSKASAIVPTTDVFNEDHPFYGKVCVFTGTLQRMVRSEAMQAVVDLGGICDDRITKRTNFLIIGNNDYCTTIKDGKSNKQKKAEQYKLAGQDIEILSENVFYDLLIYSQSYTEHGDIQTSQTISEEFNIPEKCVYKLIEETLISVIRKNYLHEKELKFQKCLGYWSVTFLSNVIARIRFGKKVSYISISARAAKPLLDKKKIKYDIKKSEPQFARVFLHSPDDVVNYLDIISISTQDILNSIPKGFDCCSRYEACSDALECLQPDEQSRLDCGYRRILASGRVFYGKNKNI